MARCGVPRSPRGGEPSPHTACTKSLPHTLPLRMSSSCLLEGTNDVSFNNDRLTMARNDSVSDLAPMARGTPSSQNLIGFKIRLVHFVLGCTALVPSTRAFSSRNQHPDKYERIDFKCWQPSFPSSSFVYWGRHSRGHSARTFTLHITLRHSFFLHTQRPYPSL